MADAACTEMKRYHIVYIDAIGRESEQVVVGPATEEEALASVPTSVRIAAVSSWSAVPNG